MNRLQRLLAELVPGQAKKDLTTLQAKAILASVRFRDIAGKTRRRIAAEELADLVAVEAKMKKATAELKVLVKARGLRLLDASSGEQNRHRLSRAGNRRMNRMIHIAAISQIRLDTPGRVYYRRKLAAGKTKLEALRCLKRSISDAIYRQLLADAERAALAGTAEPVGTGPGGHCGATQESSAVDLPPHIDTSDQPLPGPAEPTLQPRSPVRKTSRVRTPQTTG